MSLSPNRSRFWKRRQPTSLRHAVDESIDFFKEAHNGSVERLAERMGYATHWSLYKDLADMKLRITQVRAFEHGCGIDLLSRYFAASASRLTIEIPAGRPASADSIQALQEGLNDAVGALLRFYAGQQCAEKTLEAVSAAMQDLAWQRVNVAKSAEPELELL